MTEEVGVSPASSIRINGNIESWEDEDWWSDYYEGGGITVTFNEDGSIYMINLFLRFPER